MRVLVTGSAGFIGKHVVDQLLELGHVVMQFDRKLGSQYELTRMEAAQIASPDAVIHLAAHADVKDCWQNQPELWRDNVDATRRLLECCVPYADTLQKFVFISTGAVYAVERSCGDPSRYYQATSPYAASKLAGEALIQAYATRYGWSWGVIRPAAAFGKGYHHGHIKDFVKQGLSSGVISPLDSGSVSNPAVHVKDVARIATRMAAAHKSIGGVVNVASTMWSWRDTIRLMRQRRDFKVRETTMQIGFVGANSGAMFDTRHTRLLFGENRHSVEAGVNEALDDLGWCFG